MDNNFYSFSHFKKRYQITGIYCIKNVITNKCYIGQSIDIWSRIKSHFSSSSKSGRNEELFDDMIKYRKDAFEISILEELDEEYIIPIELKERKWIRNFHEKGYDLYNRDTEFTKVKKIERKDLDSIHIKEKCPFCDFNQFEVLDTHISTKTIRIREIMCLSCKKEFQTEY